MILFLELEILEANAMFSASFFMRETVHETTFRIF